MDEAFNDPRFGHIMSDPKFKKPPIFQRKVKIDKRFQRMFNDKNFQVKYTVDKRGKPVNQSSVENYGKFYALSDDDSDSDDAGNEDKDSDGSVEEQNEVRLKTKKKSKVNPIDKNKKNSKKEKDFEEDIEKRQKNRLKTKNKGFIVEDDIKEEASGDKDDVDEDDDNSEEDEKEEIEDENSDDNGESEETSDESEDDIPKEVKEEALKKVSQKRKLPQEIKDKLRDLSVDYARGMAVLSDSSSSDDSSEELSAEEEDDLEHDWGELDKDADRTDSATNRLAICNMDWDRIRAVDLMVLCSSFLPPGGVIKSVSIYVSEFGRKRMEEEEVRGPIELVEQKKMEPEIDLEDREDEDEEGNKYQMEQLRKYQLLRLKYFYAIVVCDSADTASTLYDECDGLEYESSATRLDLRFVPDDVTFDEEPRDVCTKLPDINKYQPRLFLNTALQQGKVECTWDETDPERVKLAQKLHQMKGDDNIDDTELKMFLASSEEEDEANEEDVPTKENITNDDDKRTGGSSSDESGSDNEDGVKKNAIDKYRNLLAKIQEEDEKKKNRDVEMEITWGVGLKEKAQKMVDKKLKENVPMTPFEKMIEKKREKNKLKKKERMKKNGEDPSSDKDDDSDEASSDDDVPDGIDMNDEYFREELEGFGPKKSKNKSKNKNNKQMIDSDNSEDDEETSRNARELDLLFMDENGGETQKKHFNLKKIMENEDESKKKKKRKGRKQLIKNKKKEKEEATAPYDDDFKINVADERFSALFSSHHFNIDPADAHFKKTKGMEAFIHEKLNRKDKKGSADSPLLGKKGIESVKSSNENGSHPNPAKKQKLDSSNDLSQIVNSIKRNTQFSKTKTKR
ncbi:hypothetical protein LSTR_LSTR006921 [Laodelphax striatellus]|uniref:Uncharacterized protein n=1 Tax=Laodelphax striatellus TaxID=195883 RepID=A0A482X3R7_LAOST|nr:hypothetical protein LSTR_LSTR006921 [Laodelphax striatellus]